MAQCTACQSSYPAKGLENHAPGCPNAKRLDVATEPAWLMSMKRSGHATFANSSGKITAEVTVSGSPEFVAEVMQRAAEAFREEAEK